MSRLPTELREQIWEFTILAEVGRKIRWRIGSLLGGSIHSTPYIALGERSQPTALLSVCSETRDIALKYNHRLAYMGKWGVIHHVMINPGQDVQVLRTAGAMSEVMFTMKSCYLETDPVLEKYYKKMPNLRMPIQLSPAMMYRRTKIIHIQNPNAILVPLRYGGEYIGSCLKKFANLTCVSLTDGLDDEDDRVTKRANFLEQWSTYWREQNRGCPVLDLGREEEVIEASTWLLAIASAKNSRSVST